MLGLRSSPYIQPHSHIHMHTYSHTHTLLTHAYTTHTHTLLTHTHVWAHTHTLNESSHLSPKGLLRPFSSHPRRIEKPNYWFHEGLSGSYPMPCSLSLHHPRPTSDDKCLGILIVKLLSWHSQCSIFDLALLWKRAFCIEYQGWEWAWSTSVAARSRLGPWS